MTVPFTNKSLVRDIVNIAPKTSDIFKKNRIDFCCGGARPLNEVAEEQSVDLDALMDELITVYEKTEATDDMKVWTNSSSEEIIEHIISEYHRPLHEELKALSPYVTKVAKVHGMNHPELIKVYELFYEVKKELIEHTEKEEAISFPNIMKLEANPNIENKEEIIEEIRVLEAEHDHAGDIMKQIRKITNDYALPVGACGTYTMVYKRLEMLENDLFMHVHLENNILFPRYI